MRSRIVLTLTAVLVLAPIAACGDREEGQQLCLTESTVQQWERSPGSPDDLWRMIRAVKVRTDRDCDAPLPGGSGEDLCVTGDLAMDAVYSPQSRRKELAQRIVADLLIAGQMHSEDDICVSRWTITSRGDQV